MSWPIPLAVFIPLRSSNFANINGELFVMSPDTKLSSFIKRFIIGGSLSSGAFSFMPPTNICSLKPDWSSSSPSFSA